MNTEIGRDLPSDRTAIEIALPVAPNLRCSSALVVESDPAGLVLSTHDCFLGLGVASQARPIDIVALLLAGAEMKSLAVVLVDEFAKLNGVDRNTIEANVIAQQKLVRAVNHCYGLDLIVLRAQALMATTSYSQLFRQLQYECHKPNYHELLIHTVPASRRAQDQAFDYTINEIALSLKMAEGLGYSTKFGPAREKVYDQLMRALKLPLDFCYAIDALPIGVEKPQSVVHYVASHRGSSGAERILLESEVAEISMQLERASPRSAAYLLTLAQRAAQLRGVELSVATATAQELIEAARAAVLEHIVLPLKAAL